MTSRTTAREKYESDKDILYQLDQYAVVKRADAALAEADEKYDSLKHILWMTQNEARALNEQLTQAEQRVRELEILMSDMRISSLALEGRRCCER